MSICVKITQLKENTDFVYNNLQYKYLGVTNTGRLCTFRYMDGKYVIFDVDTFCQSCTYNRIIKDK